MIVDSTNPRIMADNIRELARNGGSDLPDIGPSDYGSYLAVDELGKWGLDKPEGILPEVSISDNGKVLGVVEGAWNKMDAPSGEVDYSLTEQDTGVKWIDGKTIYRKTLSLGDILKTDTKTHDHGISNLGDVIRIYGTYEFGENNDGMPLPYVSTSLNYCVALGNVTATNFLIDIGSSYTSAIKNVYVTLEYTKATTTETKKRKTTKGEN